MSAAGSSEPARKTWLPSLPRSSQPAPLPLPSIPGVAESTTTSTWPPTTRIWPGSMSPRPARAKRDPDGSSDCGRRFALFIPTKPSGSARGGRWRGLAARFWGQGLRWLGSVARLWGQGLRRRAQWRAFGGRVCAGGALRRALGAGSALAGLSGALPGRLASADGPVPGRISPDAEPSAAAVRT